jgi:hypothetical protein
MVYFKIIYQQEYISVNGTQDSKKRKEKRTYSYVLCRLAGASLDAHVVALLSAVHSHVDPAVTAVACDTSACCIKPRAHRLLQNDNGDYDEEEDNNNIYDYVKRLEFTALKFYANGHTSSPKPTHVR